MSDASKTRRQLPLGEVSVSRLPREAGIMTVTSFSASLDGSLKDVDRWQRYTKHRLARVARVSATPSLPPPGSTLHRATARVLPVDPLGRVLLLHGWDPDRPESPYWFTLGGAVEADESLAEAAARELHEEAGITVDVAALGDPISASVIEFVWGGIHVVQDQTFFAVALEKVDVRLDGLDPLEQATIDGYGWWLPNDLEAAGGAAHPGILRVMRLASRPRAGGR
jgi:8-oxo-dGTP pyrophosphatase MutT (NUDIX family)